MISSEPYLLHVNCEGMIREKGFIVDKILSNLTIFLTNMVLMFIPIVSCK